MVSIPYAVAFALATVLSVVVTWRGIQARPRQDAGWFAVAMAGVTWWSVMKFFQVIVADFERIKILFNALHWIGVGAVSIGVLGFGLSVSGRDRNLTPPRIAALSIIPAVTVVAWFGDPRVVTLIQSYAPGATAIVGVLEAVESTWAWFEWVSLVWQWGLVTIGSVFIIEAALERPKLDPNRVLLGGMVAVPWAVNLLYEFGAIPGSSFDPTVFGFVVTGVLGIAVIDRFRLFDVPFARSQIVEEFATPVLVYGPDHRLYDYNERAVTALDLGPADLDEDVRDALADTALPVGDRASKDEGDLAAALHGTRVSIPSGDGDHRHFLVQVSALGEQTSQELGHTVQLTDITDQYRHRERIRRERDLKETIRSILIQLSSRREIERAFCDHLADDDRYSSVWIGERSGSGEIVPRTDASGDEEAASPESVEDRPMERATARTALDADDIAINREPSRGRTDDGGEDRPSPAGGAVAAVPLRNNDLTYGVLVVRADHGDAFGPEEQELLTDLSESIAFAISAVEQREALQGETVREVVVRIPDPTHYLVSLADSLAGEETNATVTVHELGRGWRTDDGGATDDDATVDSALHFLTVSGASATAVVEHVSSHAAVQSATVLTDNDEAASLRVRVSLPTLGSLLAAAGGAVQTIRVSDEAVEVVANFSPRTDMNRVIEHVRDVYPNATVESLVTEEPATVRTESPDVASLTRKQREALEAAYHSGFFERPQRQTAEEIATALDISRSTFLNHLRTAEHELLAEVLNR